MRSPISSCRPVAPTVHSTFSMSPSRSGIHNIRTKKSFRRRLRKSLTPAEAFLWAHLKDRQLAGKKFRRQVSIGRYIVDFYCPECDLVVELDGAPHFSTTRDRYEEERTNYLAAQGVTVIRFENKDVFDNIDSVLEIIKDRTQLRL